MTGPWTLRETGMCVVAVILACSICYFVGRKQGVMDEKLAQNHTAIKANDSTLTKQTEQLKQTDKQDAILTTYRSHVREKVRVYRDTVYVQNTQAGDDTTQNGYEIEAVSPVIAQLIEADDSTIKALQRSIALRDTLIGSLHKGIELRNVRIDILEKQVTPSRIKRILTATKWIAIGAIAGAAYVHR